MSDPLSDFDPTPVVPLEYYEAQTNAWTAAVRFVCIMSAIFTGAGIVVDTLGLALNFGTFSTYPFLLKNNPLLMLNLPLILIRVMVLIGCLLAVRFQVAGRQLVIWGSAVSLVASLAVMVIGVYAYANMYTPRSSVVSSDVLIRYTVSNVGTFIRGGFLPALLWYLFCRAEVRELFRR